MTPAEVKSGPRQLKWSSQPVSLLWENSPKKTIVCGVKFARICFTLNYKTNISVRTRMKNTARVSALGAVNNSRSRDPSGGGVGNSHRYQATEVDNAVRKRQSRL